MRDMTVTGMDIMAWGPGVSGSSQGLRGLGRSERVHQRKGVTPFPAEGLCLQLPPH